MLAVVAVAALVAAPQPRGGSTASAAVRYLDPMFPVDVQRDVLYARSPAPDGSAAVVPLHLDLYTPRGDTETSRPVFVYSHGGYFLFGSKSDADAVRWATLMAERGYVAASIDYRLGPLMVSAPVDDEEREQITRSRLDLQAAVRWLRANATALRIDPDRIAVGGYSAGAIISLGAALNADADSIPPDAGSNPQLSSAVCGAVSIAGANDPLSADSEDAGAIFHHGTADPLVPFDYATATRDGMIEAGLPVDWYEYAGEGHGFSPASVALIESRTIRWLHNWVATAPFPCSAAVARRLAVPAGRNTPISGSDGRSGVVSIVMVDTTGPGWVQALPCGAPTGATANGNADAAHQTRASLAIVAFPGGSACVHNQVGTHLVVDLQGYLSAGAVDDVPDTRLLDSRTGARPAGRSMTVIRGRPDSTAIVSLVVTETSGPGYVQVLPCGATPGAYANLNADAPNQTRAGLAFVRFDAGGTACVFNQTATHLVVDLQAYMQPAAFDDVDDVRLLDTRSSPPKSASATQRPITGRPGSTAVVSVVATETDGPGYLQMLPCGSRPGTTANVNADARGQTVAALAFVRFDASGQACVFSQVGTHVVVDLQGYMAPFAFDDVDDVRLLDTRLR